MIQNNSSARLDEIVRQLNGKKLSDGWLCHCPSHDDKNASLSIKETTEGKLLFHCFSGCSQEAVLTALKNKNLWRTETLKPRARTEYLYRDVSAKPALKVVRTDYEGGKKKFAQLHIEKGEWKPGGYKGRLQPYQYHKWAGTQRRVFLVEGEKTAELLSGKGLIATTTPGGSGGWKSEYSEFFKGHHVTILPDNDEPGFKYAANAYVEISKVAASTSVVELPGLDKGEDACEWFERGNSVLDLRAIVESSSSLSSQVRSLVEARSNQNATVAQTASAASLVCLADVEAKEIDWLWHPYIAKGKLTMAEGDPGVGKSYFTMALAAAVSNGGKVPLIGNIEKGNVLIFSAEDDPADTLKPRLAKLGADMTKIFIYPVPVEFNDEGVGLIEGFLNEKRPVLMIIDPLQCYLGSKDMNKANETRSVLSPLATLSSKFKTSTLIVRHLKKSADKSTYRGMGSVDILAAVRSVLLVGCNPQDKKQRAIVHIKSNLAPYGQTLGYEVENGIFSWTGTSALTASDILATDIEGAGSALDEAVEFLSETLQGGRVAAREIQKSSRDMGIATATLKRAKAKLCVKSLRINDQWFWELEKFPELKTPTRSQPVQEDQDSHLGNLSPLSVSAQEDQKHQMGNLSTLPLMSEVGVI